MMKDNIDISEFYDNGSISGETYLYCVEHDILSIQDALEKKYNDASEIVITELNEITKQYRNDSVLFRMIPYDTVYKIARLAGLDIAEVLRLRDKL